MAAAPPPSPAAIVRAWSRDLNANGNAARRRGDGPGHTAAALFVVQKGLTTRWQQVPVPPKKLSHSRSLCESF